MTKQNCGRNVRGIFSAGLRGPLYRQGVLDQIEKWRAEGTLRNNTEAIFAVVGVGLTDNKAAAMPLYNLQRCLKPNVVRPNNDVRNVYLI